MTSWTEFCTNFLSFGTAYHKLWFIYSLTLQIVSIYISTFVFSCHSSSVLPSKHVERTFVRWQLWIQTTKVKSIESSIDIGRWHSLFSILCAFCSKSWLHNSKWFWKIPIFIDFDLVYVLRVVANYKPHTEFFVLTEFDAFYTFFWRFFPFKFCNNFSSFRIYYEQVFLRFLHIPLFTAYNIVITRRIL